MPVTLDRQKIAAIRDLRRCSSMKQRRGSRECRRTRGPSNTIRDRGRHFAAHSKPWSSNATRPEPKSSHNAIDASTRGRGRIAHRSAELGYGRIAVDVVWITDEQRPFMPAKASPNHKLNVLVDHEVGSGCCGTDVAAGSTQTRRQRYRRTG
jgi:hypothetical protein